MISMYRLMPAPLFMAIGTGGAFLLNQIAIALVYHERISAFGHVGIALIFIEILIAAFLNNTTINQDLYYSYIIITYYNKIFTIL